MWKGEKLPSNFLGYGNLSVPTSRDVFRSVLWGGEGEDFLIKVNKYTSEFETCHNINKTA